MKYKVTRINDSIAFVCQDGGPGSYGARVVRGSKGYPTLRLLDELWARGHVTYGLYYQGNLLSPAEWDDLGEDEGFNAEELDIRVKSDLDVLTLCGYSFNAIQGKGRSLRHHREEEVGRNRYSRPKSRKAVQMSWFYQHGTEVA